MSLNPSGLTLWGNSLPQSSTGVSVSALASADLAAAAATGLKEYRLALGTYLTGRFAPGAQLGGIRLAPGVDFDGNGSTLVINDNNSALGWFGNVDDSYVISCPHTAITANVALFSNQITVADPSLFTVGQTVHVRLGDEPTDTNESLCFYFAKVTNKAGSVLTLDRGAWKACTIAGVSNVLNKSVFAINLLENVVIKNINFTNTSAYPEESIIIQWARNLHLQDITHSDPGAGIFLQYVEHATLDNIHCYQSALFGQASKGRSLNFAECTDIVVNDHVVHNNQGQAVFAEASSRVTCNGLSIYNNLYALDGQVLVVQQSELHIRDFYYEGIAGSVLFETSSGGSGTIRNLHYRGAGEMLGLGDLAKVKVSGTFKYEVAGVEENYDLDRAEWIELKIPITASMYTYFLFDYGLLIDAEFYVSSTVTGGQLTGLYLGRRSYDNATGDNGVSVPWAAGKVIQVTPYWGTNAGGVWSSRALPVGLLVSTAGSVGASQFIIARVKVAKDQNATIGLLNDASLTLRS